MPDLLVRKSETGRAAVITKAWEGETVAVIATGPSLNLRDLELVRGIKCVAVNDAYLVAPWADVLYAADHIWWRWQIEGREKVWAWGLKFSAEGVRKCYSEFSGQKVTIQHNQIASDESVLVLENDGPDGLSERQDAIRTGQNSGYQAINIAALSGAKKILLIGFDGRHVGCRSHAHNGHERKTDDQAYRGYAKNFSKLENPLKLRGIECLNCTPGSAIGAFPFSTVEKELCRELTV